MPVDCVVKHAAAQWSTYETGQPIIQLVAFSLGNQRSAYALAQMDIVDAAVGEDTLADLPVVQLHAHSANETAAQFW